MGFMQMAGSILDVTQRADNLGKVSASPRKREREEGTKGRAERWGRRRRADRSLS